MSMFSWTHPQISLAPFLVSLALLAWYLEATHRCDPPVARRQRLVFAAGVLALLLAGSWPIAELAAKTSLLVLIFQRELLVFVAAPLLLVGMPVEIGIRLTKPAPIDWIAVRLSRPVPAIVLTTVLLGVTAVPVVVTTASTNSSVRWLVALGTLAAGFVLWNPVVRRVPGVRQLAPFGIAGYLLVQSLAPTYLSFIWIFATHPLYPSLHGAQSALDLSPLLDQRLSGYLAKLGSFGVLWPVAYHYFSRGIDEPSSADTTLRWMDVERELERTDRQEWKAKKSKTG